VSQGNIFVFVPLGLSLARRLDDALDVLIGLQPVWQGWLKYMVIWISIFLENMSILVKLSLWR